ncbi:ECF transporter S component [Paenisporosarcina cavernae]|uniref:Riboflavin transporter n=1 Tax=Paenisporosarcina cavernae TaxID=2320858 RepID=A0A385YS96_9BACL|nr:ECF transporter S component [Paenisporosarcina cavernae]AYC29361.1 ECF transporter S component [Paenisporosarcina cavernae]
MRNKKLKAMILIAMLSSISFVLMQLNFPIPGLPPFLKVDFSDVPALIAAVIMGPIPGILVAFLKNVLYWISNGSPTGVPVGEMANFATSILFMMPVYYIYHKLTSTKGLVVGLAAGVAAMAIGMSVLNYAIFLPMYTYFLHAPELTGSALRETIVLGILPFNLIKGVLVAIAIVVLFKSMSPWLKKQETSFQ